MVNIQIMVHVKKNMVLWAKTRYYKC